MDKNQIENISIENKLWVQLKPHLFSFQYEGLPKDVHFTIAFNENSDYINLHISKNIKSGDKPKIEICRILKNDLNELLPSISISILNGLLDEVDILHKKFENSIFIPFEELEKLSREKKVNENLVDTFKRVSKIKRKKRLKVSGNLEKELNSSIENQEFQDSVFNFFKNHENQINPETDKVLVIDEKGSIITLLKVKDLWYQMKLDVSLEEILGQIMGKKLVNDIIEYVNDSIKQIQKLNSYEESKPFNNSIQLYKIDQKQQ